MNNKVINFHGSDIEVIEKKYSISKDSLINFSSNVNPSGMPVSVKKNLIENIEVLEKYPDRNNSTLKKALADYIDFKADKIAVGNGASEVTRAFIKAIRPKKALILAPTYSEYEKELLEINCFVQYLELKETKGFQIEFSDIDGDIDLFIICNPNNPTSTYINSKKIEEITKICKDKNCYVMIDETYVEFLNNYAKEKNDVISILNNEKYDNLIILRGVSKFFSLAGLRFGYAVTNNDFLLEQVNKEVNTWSVNSLVDIAVNTMVKDNEYIKTACENIEQQRGKVINRLSKIKHLKFYYPNANFVLVKILNDKTSSELFDVGIRSGFMIRNCESFMFLGDKYFRFCFLNEDENDKLLTFLENFFS